MAMGSQTKNHPMLAYVIGLVFIFLALCVGAGVIYHLTLSHHGPGLLRPLLKQQEEPESPILTEAQRQIKLARHSHFHHTFTYPRLAEENRPICFICHSEMPHNKNKRIRALLNMHTQYLACESCHIKPDENRRVIFQWASPIDQEPQGPFVGTRYDPQTGYLAESEDKFSKITPFYKSLSDGLASAVLNQDAPLARDFMRVRDQLSPAEREGVKNKFHRNTQPKGPDCQTCHAKNGHLDYRALGFSDKRIADLEHLNITGMLAKYESFYLPDLLSETPGSSKTVYDEAQQQ